MKDLKISRETRVIVIGLSATLMRMTGKTPDMSDYGPLLT